MKHWLKIASVEYGNVKIAAREDFKGTTSICRQIISAARSTDVDQAIETEEELDAINNSQLAPKEVAEALMGPLTSYSNKYTFRLLHEWPGAAAFSIRQIKYSAANLETGAEEDRREEAINICVVVWTEQGLTEAAQWWLANCYSPDHMPQDVEGPVQALAIAVSLAPEEVPEETKAKAFAGALSAWFSERHADVNPAALPLLLTMEPHYYWNALGFNSKKRAWLSQMEVGFAWALIGDATIYETFSLPDGREFEGEHFNGKPHGRGFTIDDNGARFDGRFRYGRRHGQGTVSFPGGARYIGRWWRDVAIGDSTFVEEDGLVRNVPKRKKSAIARDVISSLLASVSDRTYRRLIVGFFCILLIAPIAYSIREEIIEYEEKEQAWLGWINFCGLSPDNSASVASFLAETAFQPETLLRDFDEIAELLQAMRAAPSDRVEYLTERLGIALELTELNPSRSAAEECARTIDSAMTDYVNYLDEVIRSQPGYEEFLKAFGELGESS